VLSHQAAHVNVVPTMSASFCMRLVKPFVE